MSDPRFVYTRQPCEPCKGTGRAKKKRRIGAHPRACAECGGRGYTETRHRVTKADRDVFNAFFGD